MEVSCSAAVTNFREAAPVPWAKGTQEGIGVNGARRGAAWVGGWTGAEELPGKSRAQISGCPQGSVAQ